MSTRYGSGAYESLEAGLPRRFEYRLGRSLKFWQVEVASGSLTMTTTWGRIGTVGQSLQKQMSTYRAVLACAYALIDEKLGKGYMEVPPVIEPPKGPWPTRKARAAEEGAYNIAERQRRERLARYAEAVTDLPSPVDFEDVRVGNLDDEDIAALASKLAKIPGMGRRARALSQRQIKCQCGKQLVSDGEMEAGKCASCLMLALTLRGGGDVIERKRVPDLLDPVRKIRFTE